jgi:hypothetical protein
MLHRTSRHSFEMNAEPSNAGYEQRQVQIAIEHAGFEFFRLTKLSSVVMLSALK